MSNPLYAFPTVVRTDAAGAGALSVAHRVQLAGRIDHLSGRDRHDRPHAERVHAARPCSPAPASRSSPPTAPTPGAPASPRNCRGSRSPGCIRWARSTISCFSSRIPKPQMLVVDADDVPRSRRRTRRAGRPACKTVFTLGPGRLRRRSAAGGRSRRQRHRAQFRRPRRHRDAELHRRHDRQIQGRAALPSRNRRLRQRDPRRFRNSGYAALSRRWRRSAMSPAPRCCRR